ncbi:peptidoglycan bridge formation glycyltransferase FemA/FemB family protein [bacterium]|nr:peptidoglycan bridge formation glycyltransferase FemA/FemB family protein [bacterium]
MIKSATPYTINENPEFSSWKAFLEKSPHSTVFHTPEMFQVFQNSLDYQPRIYAAEKNGSILAMFLPVLVTLKPGLLRSLTTRAIHYGGSLYQETEQGREAYSYLLDYYINDINNHALFSDIRNLTDPASVLPLLRKKGFVKEPHINYWIGLDKPPDKIWQQFHKSARRNVRLAEKRGVTFETIKERSMLPLFYQNLKRTFAVKHIPLPDLSLFENIFNILVPKNMAMFFLAKAEGKPFASFLVLVYHKIIYLWYSADDFKMRNYYPTDGFIWHILKWGHQNGYRLFDFGWAGRIDQPYGVRQFKEKFGGDLIEFGRYIYVHKPALLKISKIGYDILQVWGKITKKITGMY